MESGAGTWPDCPQVEPVFVHHVQRTLSDSTDLFQGAYPAPPPLTCELLEGLQQRLKNDSAAYHFERFSRRYWSADGMNRNGFRFIRWHRDFDLAVAATAHWNADIRINALDELLHYRRIRPMVCTTREGYARLKVQDERAIPYLITVLEKSPWWIAGSENSTIHSAYIGKVLEALDLFTGTRFFDAQAGGSGSRFNDDGIRKAIASWKQRYP